MRERNRRDPAGPGPLGLQDFAGRWRLVRSIADARAGLDGRMEGWARFEADGDGLTCTEEGLLRYGDGPALQATRRYLWRESEGRIAVLFADGGAFHDFALAKAAAAVHHCAPDRYEVSYDFAGWPRWRAVWRVAGPRKDYVSVTDYSPAP